MAVSELTRTGISGLDALFLGGILQGNIILVEGTPGTGKTLMGLEFIYRGITVYQEPGIIVVFEMTAFWASARASHGDLSPVVRVFLRGFSQIP